MQDRGKRKAEAFLNQVSYILGQSLDYTRTLKSITDLVVGRFADWCTIDILDEKGEIRLLALSHRDAKFEQEGQVYRAKYPPRVTDNTGISLVLKTNQPILIERLSDVEVKNGKVSPEHHDLLLKAGAKSLMLIPLQHKEMCFGVLTMISTREGRYYDARDLSLAVELGRQASLALENARLYSELKHKEESLNEALQDRDQFLSIASHELRTPLTPIKLQLQGILRLVHEKMTPEAQKKVCDLAEKTFQQVDRLAGLLDELLDTARIGAKRLALRPQSVSPAALAREVCERYAYHDVKLETLCSSSTTAQWDRLRVEQVLVNLITNAIKHAPGSPIHVKVDIRGKDALFEVADHGPGIAQADFTKIFERYQRAGSTLAPGLGLGLFIAKEIVEAHGGRIWVESVVGNGSTFYVQLPLEPRFSGLA